MQVIKTFKFISVIVFLFLQFLFVRDAHSKSNKQIQEWNLLLESNKKFVKNFAFSKQRAKVKNKQNPSIIVLSCADSRVTPEYIFDAKVGELFVVRVAGQVVDDVVVDSIEYAVKTFDAKIIVVLGHSNCGAVDGALKHLRKNGKVVDRPRGHLGAVLIPIETAILKSGINISGPKAFEESIQENIKYIADQLILESNIIAEYLKTKKILIVGAQYLLDTGKVEQLFIMPEEQKSRK